MGNCIKFGIGTQPNLNENITNFEIDEVQDKKQIVKALKEPVKETSVSNDEIINKEGQLEVSS